MKTNCCDLYFLSTIACQLGICLTEREQKLLAANLKALGELLEVTLVQQESCREETRLPVEDENRKMKQEL